MAFWMRGKPAKDPVCGMEVPAAKAAGTSVHGDLSYHFCSTACKTRFDAQPSKFA